MNLSMESTRGIAYLMKREFQLYANVMIAANIPCTERSVP